jgi:hypothetical protein
VTADGVRAESCSRIIGTTDGPLNGHPRWAVRDPRCHRGRRYGGGLSRSGSARWSRCRGEGRAGRCRTRRRRFRRFEQEARVVGAMNHPNLLTQDDVAISEGRQYLATELVDAASADRPRPISPLCRDDLRRNCARACHSTCTWRPPRDLKPENVMLTPDGPVKILDFRIAKLRGSGEPARYVGTAGRDGGTNHHRVRRLHGARLDARGDGR